MGQLKSVIEEMHERLRGSPARPVDVPTPEEKHTNELYERVDALVAVAVAKFQKMWKNRRAYKKDSPTQLAHKALKDTIRFASETGKFSDCTPEEMAEVANVYAARVNDAMREAIENLDFVRAEETAETIQ